MVGSCEKISRFAEHALNDFPCQQGEGTVHRMSSRKQEREEEEEEEEVVVVVGDRRLNHQTRQGLARSGRPFRFSPT